ncbi:monothiol glutaredoxin-S3-like [Papaver somniferum]|uniref:monothiol glutaredoxin-S3-like n=1 Tax=Papaver somniferum TaxID=3469 RepID=UPI000E6FAD57|nr:monothiol glutaredoxin-S3-like [Papaver somniferum]
MERVTRLASQRAIVIFSKSTCCMSHTIKTLFYDLGVNPTVHELDEEPGAGKEIEKALISLGCNPSVPAIFIGGKLVGGVSEVMTLHLSCSLVPLLKQAGAIWL